MRKLCHLTLIVVSTILTTCISTNVPDPVPFMTTNAVDAQITTAISGGVILETAGFPVLEKGVVWSSQQTPSLDNAPFTTEGSGPMRFESTMTGLTPASTYYVRSYATTANGTGYGNELEFTTRPCPVPDVDVYEVDESEILNHEGTACGLMGPAKVTGGDTETYRMLTNLSDPEFKWTIVSGDMSFLGADNSSEVTVQFGQEFTSGCITISVEDSDGRCGTIFGIGLLD